MKVAMSLIIMALLPTSVVTQDSVSTDCDTRDSQALLQSKVTVGIQEKASTVKMRPPSWLMVFSSVMLLGLLFGGISSYLSYKECRGCGCICCGSFGVFMIVLAIALVVLKVWAMHLAGPSPAGPIKQTPITTEVVVDTIVPFSVEAINTPGPVQTAYMEGMQDVLDAEGTKGAVKVVGVHASPAAAPVGLFQQQLTAESSRSRSRLVYSVSMKDANRDFTTKPLLPPASSALLGSAVQEAAKRQMPKGAKREGGPEVPELLKEVANGSKSAATKPTVEVTISTSFRCEARHELNEDIRAAGRAFLKKHMKDRPGELEGELERFAQRKMSGVGTVKLADRCNDPSQDGAMRVCIGEKSLWVDYVTTQAVAGSKDSVQSSACRAGCWLAKALSAETARVIATVNERLPVFEIDKKMVQPISCVPTLSEGEDCDPVC